ncbi:MAG TPA: NAD(P)-binding domain-containing protein [Methyloceanibacter sp.]
MKIAIVGADDVGRSLGAALRSKGHTIVYGIPEPERSDERNAKSVGEALRTSETVILATPWTLTEALVCEHATDLADKIVIDATNPLNPP